MKLELTNQKFLNVGHGGVWTRNLALHFMRSYPGRSRLRVSFVIAVEGNLASAGAHQCRSCLAATICTLTILIEIIFSIVEASSPISRAHAAWVKSSTALHERPMGSSFQGGADAR
jgi:hypothetical protein